MAFKHGSTAGVMWNQYDVSGYLRSAELSVGVEPADTSTFGDGWKKAIVGLGESSATFEGLYDPATQAYWRDQLAVSSGVLTYAPSGWATLGDPARLLLVTSTSYGESSPVGDAVAFSWGVMSESVFAAGHVLNPLSSRSTTGNGSALNGGASTSTGWTAHLHVTAVTGGSWVVKIGESADGVSSWGDPAGGASFTAATGATSQRLRSASSTSFLDQYIRYTATKTGGAGGDSITFLLAVSRTF